MVAMKLNLTADEVLKTTRSVRKRLDFDKPNKRRRSRYFVATRNSKRVWRNG